MTKFLLNAAAILSAPDVKTIDINVPEWGGSVRLKAATPSIIAKVRAEAPTKTEVIDGKTVVTTLPDEYFGYRLLARSVVDEEGSPVFTSEDIASLIETKSVKVLERLMSEVNKLNGHGDTDLGKDSSETEKDASTSASPSPSDGLVSSGD